MTADTVPHSLTHVPALFAALVPIGPWETQRPPTPGAALLRAGQGTLSKRGSVSLGCIFTSFLSNHFLEIMYIYYHYNLLGFIPNSQKCISGPEVVHSNMKVWSRQRMVTRM